MEIKINNINQKAFPVDDDTVIDKKTGYKRNV
jgi:hypothetical protein